MSDDKTPIFWHNRDLKWRGHASVNIFILQICYGKKGC